MNDARLKARLRLWLRAERAMGLDNIPISRVVVSAFPPAETPPRPPNADRSTPNPGQPAPIHRAPVTPSQPVASASQNAPPADRIPTDPPFTAAILSAEQKTAALRVMDEREVTGCTRCRLCQSRTNTVFGEGDPNARIFFIGEGPGANEDRAGRPFIGRAGELLEKMINGMGLKREDVFIANLVKCRPPDNREPASDEVAACVPYLERQLEIVRPAVIVTLGRPATQHLLKTKLAMGKLRGQWHTWRGIRLMPTYHPAYILRCYTPEVRGAVWGDLQEVMREVGLKSTR